MTLLNAVAAAAVAVRMSRIQIVAPVMVIAVGMIVTFAFVAVYEHRFIILAMMNLP